MTTSAHLTLFEERYNEEHQRGLNLQLALIQARERIAELEAKEMKNDDA